MDQANWGCGSRSLLANNKITIDVDDTALDELQVPGTLFYFILFFVLCFLFFKPETKDDLALSQDPINMPSLGE